jgi:hypothetical protein
MKNIKLLLALMAGLFVANAAFALDLTGATAYSSSVGGYGPGAAVIDVVGTNGNYRANTSGGTPGSVSPVTAVENVNTVLCVVVSPWYPASHESSVYVVIPEGCTGEATYGVSKDVNGPAYVRIGSTTYTTSGTLTLGPGTYYLYTFASMSGNCSVGPSASIYVTITLVCLPLWLFARMGVQLVGAKSHSGPGRIAIHP